MISSSRTQLRAGYSTFQIISGLQSMRNLLNVISMPHPSRRLGQREGQGRRLKQLIRRLLGELNNMFNAQSSLREYNVMLSSGEVIYILARSSEQAAWSALELAGDRTLKLVDVRQTDEW